MIDWIDLIEIEIEIETDLITTLYPRSDNRLDSLVAIKMKVIRERLRASVARESITLQLSMKEA
jgi:hypothetical protein